MLLAVPHQDVLIIADIENEIGYDVLAQLTMSFLQAVECRLPPSHFYTKMGNFNRFLFSEKSSKG